MPRSWSELLGEENAAPEPEEARGGMFSRLRDSLSKSRRALTEQIAAAAFDPGDDGRLGAARGGADPADVGVRATASSSAGSRSEASSAIWARRSPEEIAALFGEPHALDVGGAPGVILVVGVNGTGKTTTIGKLASALSRARPRSCWCAADTYRAAAEEQLEIWAQARRARTSSAASAAATRRPSRTTRSSRPSATGATW